jgi:hypothetical protein
MALRPSLVISAVGAISLACKIETNTPHRRSSPAVSTTTQEVDDVPQQGLNLGMQTAPVSELPPVLWNSWIESGMKMHTSLGSGNIIMDPSGITYHCATFSSPQYPDTQPFPVWLLITKRSSTGEILWSKHVGRDFNFPHDASSKCIIRFAKDGGLVAAMSYYRHQTAFPPANVPSHAAVVTRLSTDGQLVWSRSIPAPSVAILPFTNPSEYRTLAGLHVHSTDGLIYVFGDDGNTLVRKGFISLLDDSGKHLTTRYVDLPLTRSNSSSALISILPRDDGGLIIVGGYSQSDGGWSTNPTEQVYAFRTGRLLQARGISKLFGSSIPTVSNEATFLRPRVATRRAGGNFLVYNSLFDSLLELNINLDPVAHLKAQGNFSVAATHMEAGANDQNIYIYSNSAGLASIPGVWNTGFTDGHLIVINAKNELMEDREFGLTGSSSALVSGTGNQLGYHAFSQYHAGRDNLTIQVVGGTPTFFNDWLSLAPKPGAVFEVDRSRTCEPKKLAPVALPMVVPGSFGLSPNVPISVSPVPEMKVTDATDIVWRYIKN